MRVNKSLITSYQPFHKVGRVIVIWARSLSWSLCLRWYKTWSTHLSWV